MGRVLAGGILFQFLGGFGGVGEGFVGLAQGPAAFLEAGPDVLADVLDVGFPDQLSSRRPREV